MHSRSECKARIAVRRAAEGIKSHSGRRILQAAIEAMESRLMLSTTLVVNTSADTPVGNSTITGQNISLRQAITYENANGGGTISLARSPFLFLSTAGDSTAGPSVFGIYANITLVGGTDAFLESESAVERMFYIGTQGSLTLENVSIAGGEAVGAPGTTGGGAAGLGGAIFNQGSLTVIDSSLYDNTAQGGSGGTTGGDGGGGLGGAGGQANDDGDAVGGGPNGGTAGSGFTGPGGNGGFGGGGGAGGAPGNGYYIGGGTGGFGGGGGGGAEAGSDGGTGGFGGGGGAGYPIGASGGFGGGDSAGIFAGGGGGLGGAIFNAAGTVSIINSTFSEDSALGGSGTSAPGATSGGGDGFGGAIFNLNGTLSLIDDTFAGNTVAAGAYGSSSSGGADIYNLGLPGVVAYVGGASIGAGTATTTANNTIFASTTGGDPTYNNPDGGTASVGGAANLAAATDANSFSNVTASSSINLGSFGYHDSDAETFSLEFGSSAIGAGSAAANTAAGITTDERGIARPASDPDIGAYQTQSVYVASISDQSSNAYNASLATTGDTVTFAVTLTAGVSVSGSPLLELSNGADATYASTSGDTLTFTYVVANGQDSPQITTTGLNFNGGTIAPTSLDVVNVSGFVNTPSPAIQIITTPPTVVFATATPTVTVGTVDDYTVTFSVPVTGVTAADFSNVGTAGISVGTVSEVSSTVFTVPVTPSTIGTIQLSIGVGADIINSIGTPLLVPATDTTTVTVVTLAPNISFSPASSAVPVNTPDLYTLSFDRPVTGVSASEFVNAGTAAVSIGTLSELSSSQYTLSVTPVSPGTIVLQVVANAPILDLAGTPLVTPVTDTHTVDADEIPSLTVTTTADSVNPLDGLTSLPEAVSYAESLGGNQTVTFAPSLTASGPATITLSSAGDGTAGPSDFGITSNITIVGPAGNNGITLANSGEQRLFYVGTQGSLTLANLTLSGGDAAGGTGGTGGGAAGLGGAIFNQGTLVLANSTFTNDTAQGGSTVFDLAEESGAGMGGNSSEEPGANGGGPNGGTGGGNGGFGGGGADAGYGGGNGGAGGFGGGGAAGSYYYSGGAGGFGGGGGGGGDGAGSTPSPGGFGAGSSAGYYSFGGGGGGMGGAIFNAAGTVSIVNSTFTQDSAQGGSGERYYNSISTGNGGSGFGGAIFNLNGTLSLTNDTFTGNSVAAGGSPGGTPGTSAGADVYNLGLPGVVAYVGGPGIGAGTATTTANNTIFASTSGGNPTYNNPDNGGTATVSGGSNLAAATDANSFANITASSSIDLGTLGLNGGPTETFPLDSGSAAIGSGSASAFIAAGLTTDQRGYGFVQTPSTVDIGAYQTGALAPQTPGLVVTTTVDTLYGSGDSLRTAIAYAESLGGNQTITFAPVLTASGPATITLDGSVLSVDQPGGTLTIQGPTGAAGITVNGNNASQVFSIHGGTSVDIFDLTITGGNGNEGGGIYIGGSTVTLAGDTISGNTALNGGAIDSATGTLTMFDDTVAGNTATQDSGGLYGSLGGTANLIDDTISGNIAASLAGGILTTGGAAITLTNTIVAGNTAVTAPDIYGKMQSASSYDLIGNGADLSGISNGINQNIVGVASPDLGALGNYGGPTETIPLDPGSLAIGAASAAANTADGITTDQRGIARSATAPSIGAYELLSTQINLTAPSIDYTGAPYSAAVASATAPQGIAAPAVTLTYYQASDTTFSDPIAAPTADGSYVVVASFAGNSTFAPAVSVQKSFTIAADFANITSQLQVVRGGFVYNSKTKAYSQTLTITNTGSAITGSISLVLGGLSVGTLANATGQTTSANPLSVPGSNYITLAANSLASNASTTVTLQFNTTSPPTYSMQWLAGNSIY